MLDKYELAKELTIAAINNKLINPNTNTDPSNGNTEEYCKAINENIAKNVAAFYNKLIQNLTTETD
jgi:hypothetical protein